jgi:hypothetical protein
MRPSPTKSRNLLLAGMLWLFTAGPLGGQTPVFNQVTVTTTEAGVEIEFQQGPPFSAVLRAGSVQVNREEIGRYTPGDALDRAWRALLAQVVAQESGSGLRTLRDWVPPSELPDALAPLARQLAERIRQSLPVEPAGGLTPSESGRDDPLLSLLRRSERLSAVGTALSGRRIEPLRTYIGTQATIGADETWEGAVLMVDAEVVLEGRIRGDVFLVGGELELGPEARIDGDLRWEDARILGPREGVRGTIVELATPEAESRSFREEIEAGLREGIRGALEDEAYDRGRRQDAQRSALRNVLRGMGGVFQTAVSALLLTGLGLGLLTFFPRRLEVIARTADGSTKRSALTGLATLVLLLPVWLLGAVALVLTLIGIPLALIWLPAFPLLVGLAMIAGFLAVAWIVGLRFSTRLLRGRFTVHRDRPVAQLALGVVLLLTPFLLSHLFRMGTPFLGVFQGLFTAVGFLAGFAALAVGLGAIVLSRGGQDPRYAGPAGSLAREALEPESEEGFPTLDTDLRGDNS